MDQTTREAIDERLKVLEGVSTAVYRCIDDLMKMRSALPPVGSAQFHVDTEAALAESDTDTPVSVEQNEAL
jgi:E3 ubiquitin-protein ligase synoviolin